MGPGLPVDAVALPALGPAVVVGLSMVLKLHLAYQPLMLPVVSNSVGQLAVASDEMATGGGYCDRPLHH